MRTYDFTWHNTDDQRERVTRLEISELGQPGSVGLDDVAYMIAGTELGDARKSRKVYISKITEVTATVECGACSAELQVTERAFRNDDRADCECGGWADLAHARRHASWEELTA